jgi:hypothetical protein
MGQLEELSKFAYISRQKGLSSPGSHEIANHTRNEFVD